jgi:cupin 2 domain-containing protein
MRVGNLHSEIPADLPEELFTTLVGGPGLRIERIVSRGHRSSEGSWYDQECPSGEPRLTRSREAA